MYKYELYIGFDGEKLFLCFIVGVFQFQVNNLQSKAFVHFSLSK